MTDAKDTKHGVAISELGEQLSALRLCDPTAVQEMQQSLTRYGQLTAIVLFTHKGKLEVIDGFKRLQAARRLGWTTMRVCQQAVDTEHAITQIAALHTGRALTELEEGFIVRALYREHGLSQPAIAQRLARHKSWVCRRLLLVEALDAEAQVQVRLGLLAPRSAVALAALPRGNQLAASDVVVRRGLTVRQTELLVRQMFGCDGDGARTALLARWACGELAPSPSGRPPTHAVRSEADWLVSDVAALHRIAARVQARLLAAPLLALGPAAAELVSQSLESLAPVLTSLTHTITRATTSRSHTAPADKEAAA